MVSTWLMVKRSELHCDERVANGRKAGVGGKVQQAEKRWRAEANNEKMRGKKHKRKKSRLDGEATADEKRSASAVKAEPSQKALIDQRAPAIAPDAQVPRMTRLARVQPQSASESQSPSFPPPCRRRR
jgi:hypothetical protein